MDTPELECQDCSWVGGSIDLESATSDLDDTNYIHCPDCGGSDIEETDTDEQD